MLHIEPRSAALFAIGYASHAGAVLTIEGRVVVIPLPPDALVILAAAGLALAVTAIWLELRRLDEVQRGFALNACAISFLVTATLSYLRDLPGIRVPFAEASLWAVALAVWLVSFGLFQWRAR